MYQINQITGYGLRSFGQFPTMQEAAASLGSWVNILCAEIDDDHPDCMDVMSNDGRQFTIEPVRENNETALWYDTSAELGK